MISKEEVEKIAKLARLELSEKEIQKMQKDLSAILDYFDLLKKAPPVKATVNKSEKPNLRLDEVSCNSNIKDKLIDLAPNKKDGYIKVKQIL